MVLTRSLALPRLTPMLYNQLMRSALIILALLLCASAAQAQGTPPRREDPLQRKLQSVVQLEMLEVSMTRRKASATDRNTTLAEVREGKRTADRALVNSVLAVIDRIGELVQAMESGESVGSEDDEQLIAALSSEAAVPALQPEAPVAAENDNKKAVRSIRLSVDLLDRMMSGISDAVLARNELARRLRDRNQVPMFATFFHELKASGVPVKELYQLFPKGPAKLAAKIAGIPKPRGCI